MSGRLFPFMAAFSQQALRNDRPIDIHLGQCFDGMPISLPKSDLLAPTLQALKPATSCSYLENQNHLGYTVPARQTEIVRSAVLPGRAFELTHSRYS